MDQVQKDKLVANVKASPKMLSVQLTAVFAAIGASLTAILAAIPLDQQIAIMTSLLSHWGWGLTLVPIIGGLLRYYARVHPQADLTPAEAEAKSATVGPAEIAAGTKAAVDEAPGLPPVDVLKPNDNVDPTHRY